MSTQSGVRSIAKTAETSSRKALSCEAFMSPLNSSMTASFLSASLSAASELPLFLNFCLILSSKDCFWPGRAVLISVAT